MNLSKNLIRFFFFFFVLNKNKEHFNVSKVLNDFYLICNNFNSLKEKPRRKQHDQQLHLYSCTNFEAMATKHIYLWNFRKRSWWQWYFPFPNWELLVSDTWMSLFKCYCGKILQYFFRFKQTSRGEFCHKTSGN